MSELGPVEVVMAAGLALATYTDLRWRKIPNPLNLILLVMGLVLNALQGQTLFALIGVGAAFVVHFPLWLLGLQKAGDSKLMMAAGALVGWQVMIEMTFWKYVLLLPVGVLVLLVMGRLGNLVRAVRYTADRARGRKAERPEPTQMPYAPVIAAAWVASLLTDWFAFF